MGEQNRKLRKEAVRHWAVAACMAGLVLPGSLRMASHHPSDIERIIGVCQAAQTEELFSVDVAKQKEAISRELDRIDDILYSQAKLQESRSAIDVLEHKIDRIRKNLTKEEFETYRKCVEKQRKAVPFKEDSLINKTIEVLHGQGVEASLQFTQNDLRQHGVSDQKIAAVEKRILEEAPAIKQTQEREQIAYALKALQNGELPDSSFDPYIVRTAQLILKAHEDSMHRVENAKKRKEMEEQERLERAAMEKEMKEKKIEDERLAKQRKEEEKKNAMEQTAERKRLATEEKEKQQQARIEEERQKKTLAAQKDSIAQGERQRDAKLSEERMKQLKQQQEKNGNDSIERQRSSQQAVAAQQQRSRQLLEQHEKERNDSIARQRKSQQAVTDAQNSKRKSETAAAPSPVAIAEPKPPAQQGISEAQSAGPVAPVQQPLPINKSAQAYLQSLKDNQKDAQKKVMEIYDLVEQKQGNAALEMFKRNRSFIGKNVESQVFNVLEQAVLQSVMESSASAAATGGDIPAAGVSPSKPVSSDQQCYDLINGYLRDNKIDAAYAEFKRGEKQLKNAMTKAEFKQLKKMVENAYKTRHPGK